MSASVQNREYLPLEERLDLWRRASLSRQRRFDELEQVRDPSYHSRNLAAQTGASVRVDSFLGTINTEDVEGAYLPPERIRAGGYAFRREDPSHPELSVLRERYALDDIAGGGDDFARAVRLRRWLKTRWPHELPFVNPPYNGLTILDRASRGERFICMHYSVTLVHCCAALNIDARVVNLHRGVAEECEIGSEWSLGIDEHVTTEVYCRELGKWVMIDPDFDCHFERDATPLSSWEIHCAHLASERPTAVKGPGAAAYDSLGPDFYETILPSYYAHVSLLLRNDFMSDPDGPVPILHPVDAATPRILWYRGEDMRLRPDLLGPLVVARPYTDRTPLLTDGDLNSGWASEDNEVEHWVEVAFAAPQGLGIVALHWPEWRSHFRTSRRYWIEGRIAGSWQTITEAVANPERPWTVHDVCGATVEALRVIQPPGCGFTEHPNRLWLSQIVCLTSEV